MPEEGACCQRREAGGDWAQNQKPQDSGCILAAVTIGVAFARAASQRRSEENLATLREGVARARRRDVAREESASAHAGFYRLLADATAVPGYLLLGQFISETVRDMLVRAGPSAAGSAAASRRRVIECLERRDAHCAAREVERLMTQLGDGAGRPGNDWSRSMPEGYDVRE